LYNGKEPCPDNEILKLSDHFMKPSELGLQEKAYPLLELEVKVININEGRNTEIVNRCRKLMEYSIFIAKIHSIKDEIGSLEKSIEEAVKYCQKHDILNEFLEIHASEVLNMILTEWNTEDAIAFAREEGREDGIEEGIEIGLVEGKAKEREIWQNLVADKDTEIAQLRAQLEMHTSET